MAEVIDIDAVVREVLRRLQALTAAAPASPSAAAVAPKPPAAPKPAAAATPEPSTLHFTERLVTLAALNGKLNGHKQLAISRKAIVTPAVVDELKRRGIAIVRHDAVNSQNAQVRLLVSATSGSVKASVRSDLSSATAEVEWIECHATNSLVGAAQELTRHITQRKLPGLLLTEQPLTAAVVANRNPGIRAAVVSDGRSLDEALSQIGCNLVAVDPRRVGPAVLKIVAQRLADAQPTCPAALAGK